MPHSSIQDFFRLGMPFWVMIAIATYPFDRTMAEEFFEDQIETLDTIEVPATFVIQEERHIAIPNPTMNDIFPLTSEPKLLNAVVERVTFKMNVAKVTRDSIADRKGIRSPVRPAKAERPPYPQFAREQGWEGTVVLRIRVNHTGSVDAVRTQKSSGFPILDESAVQSVKSWRFLPAKDGEFPIPVTVDLPIRFDLDEQ